MRRNSALLRALGATSLLLTLACTAGVDSPVVPHVKAPDHGYLISPIIGYPLDLTPTQARELERIFVLGVEQGDVDAATLAVMGLIQSEPNLHPALVLRAQLDFLNEQLEDAKRELGPVLGRFPDYTAVLLVAGRTDEKLGKIPEAYGNYWAASVASELAARRAEELAGRALEIVYNRLNDDLARGRVEAASGELERMTAWAPNGASTLMAAWRVAQGLGDEKEELSALRRLVARPGDQTEYLRRQADLELRFGDAGEAVQIYTSLAEQHPDDPDLSDGLARAKFFWRVRLLPPEVQAISGRPQLTRADFATLLYWLLPEVRRGRSVEGRIANDILDHPHRVEIVKVVNLRLMDLDTRLHKFSPDEPLMRGDALRALLQVLGQRRVRISCLSEFPSAQVVPVDSICRVAAQCGISRKNNSCLPTGSVSGEEGLELSRRTLELLGES